MHAQASISVRMSPSGAQALAARNLDLLRAIENTVDNLVADTDLVRSICRTYVEIRQKLSATDTEIDPTGHISAALADSQLSLDDGVTDAYSAFMETLNGLHSAIEEFREWIATHDAVLQPTTGETFGSVSSLFDSLLANK